MIDDVVDEQRGGEHAAHLDHKHHRVLDHAARIELAHRIDQRLAHDFRIPKTLFFNHDSLLFPSEAQRRMYFAHLRRV